MGQLFHEIFYVPLLNLLVVIYNLLPNHDLGLSIIILTVLVKAVLFPISWKQIKAQQVLQDIQPRLEAIKELHKDDKQALMQAQIQLFQEHNFNPLSSCLPILVQFPFLIAIYYVFISGLGSENLNELYSFVPNPGNLNSTLLGIVSLTEKNTIVLPVIAGLLQFWQTKMLFTKRPPKVPGSRDEDFSAILNQQMLYFAPIMTVIFGYQFPAGLALYWLVNTLLTIAQQYFFRFTHKKTVPRGDGAVVATQ